MPAANRAVAAGSAPPARRASTRGAGFGRSTAAVVGTAGATVLTGGASLGGGVGLRRRETRDGGPVGAARCGLDLGPPAGGPRGAAASPVRWTHRPAPAPYPRRATRPADPPEARVP